MKEKQGFIIKRGRRNKDFIFNLKLSCASIIFYGYFMIIFILPVLLYTELPILAFTNVLIASVGVIIEISKFSEKRVFRIISDACVIVGVIYFIILICRIFV